MELLMLVGVLTGVLRLWLNLLSTLMTGMEGGKLRLLISSLRAHRNETLVHCRRAWCGVGDSRREYD